MKWYTKLALIFGGIILFIGGFIVYDQLTQGNLVYKTIAEGTQGKQQTLRFTVKKPGSPHVLIIHPSIESGWGDPDVFIEATLKDLQNNVLVSVGMNTVFGGKRLSPTYQRGYEDYEEKFTFKPRFAGEHTLTFTVLTEHVKDVYVAVKEKGK